MKRILAALLAFALQAGNTGRDALIEGITVDRASVPVGGVRLTARNVKTGATVGPTTSAADGHFLIEPLPPGAYEVTTSKNGYAPARPEQRKTPGLGLFFDVSSGEHLRNIVIGLDRAATISGRVLDLTGSPVVLANVTAVRPFYDEFGNKTLRSVSGVTASRTDDRGDFRIFGLSAGEFYVRVGGPNDNPNSGIPYNIYYPSETDVSRATAIRVEAGQEVSLNTILVAVPKQAPVRVNVIPEAGVVWGEYRTWQVGPIGLSQYATSTAISRAFGGPEGFMIAGLPTGRNQLRMGWDTPEGKVYGEVTFEVANSSERTAVDLLVRRGVLFSARALLETSAGTVNPLPDMNIELVSDSLLVNRFRGVTAANGTLSFRSTPQLTYRLLLTGVPENAYIDRIEQKGRNIPWGKIVVAGETEIEVVAKQGGGMLGGMVTDSAGKPVAGSMVALVPLEKELIDHAHLYRSTMSDQNGKFSIRHVAPGVHQLFAWIEAPGPGSFLNPEFLSTYEGRGKQVRISEGEHEAVSIRLADDK